MNSFFTNAKDEPVLLMGLQSNNSSTGTAVLDREIGAVLQFGGNLLEAPVYWCQIEPEMDRYDFSMVEDLILRCRKAGLYLIILWFATSKNGHPNYAPEYIKRDPDTYAIAKAANGAPVASLSPHCEATLARDAQAFSRLMAFLREFDGDTRTVMAVQVQNEMGLANTDRDYSALAQRDYDAGVPEALAGITLEDCGDGCDPTAPGWRGRFGRHAHEAFSAWYHARYMERVAQAGKAAYGLPLITNVMLGEQGIEEAGYNYNAGAAVGRVLDIYKRAAPSLDLLCPDIYTQDEAGFRRVCGRYAREDNALFVPESPCAGIANALNMLTAIAEYGCVGYACFGANYTLDGAGELLEDARPLAISMRAAMGLAPLLLRYRGTGRVHALIQREFASGQYIRLADYHVEAKFISANPGKRYGLGSRVNLRDPANARHLQERGRALLIDAGDDTFYIAGAGVEVDFIRRSAPMDAQPFQRLTSRQNGTLNFLSVEEGHFEGDTWVVDYVRNGDEANFAVYVHDGQVVRIRLNPVWGRME